MKQWQEKPERKKWINKQINKLKEQFFMQGWEVVVTYYKNPDKEREDVGARMITTVEYRRAELQLYPKFWDQPKEQRENCLVHEFCHVINAWPFVLLDRTTHGFMVTDTEIHLCKEFVTTWMESIICSK